MRIVIPLHAALTSKVRHTISRENFSFDRLQQNHFDSKRGCQHLMIAKRSRLNEMSKEKLRAIQRSPRTLHLMIK